MRSLAFGVGALVSITLVTVGHAQRARTGAPRMIEMHEDGTGGVVLLGEIARRSPRGEIREIPRPPYRGECCSPGRPIEHVAELGPAARARTFTVFTERGARVVRSTAGVLWRIGGERATWRDAWRLDAEDRLAARVVLEGAHPGATLIEATPSHETTVAPSVWSHHVRALASVAPSE